MPCAAVRDLQMHYAIRGSGPRLLGIGATGWVLGRSPGILEMPLAGQFEVLAYDPRGFGQTVSPDTPCSMADYAADANALLDALGWERCAVVGISFGGMVAQELALRYPQRVERLVLACTSSGGAGGASYPLHQLADLPPAEHARRFLLLSDRRRNEMVDATTFQSMVEQMQSRLLDGLHHPLRGAGARRQLAARAGHDTYSRLHALRLPVYLCGGRYDDIAPPANLDAMREQIPGALLELFEGGHTFYDQDPNFQQRILEFLQARLDRPTS
ncbi:MAG: alpha/beta hydrolase [Pseudomonadota bacterium]